MCCVNIVVGEYSSDAAPQITFKACRVRSFFVHQSLVVFLHYAESIYSKEGWEKAQGLHVLCVCMKRCRMPRADDPPSRRPLLCLQSPTASTASSLFSFSSSTFTQCHLSPTPIPVCPLHIHVSLLE